jgi:hypothetical protein
LQGVRRNSEERTCRMHSHTLGCEGTTIWSDEILGKRFRKFGAELDIKRAVGFKNKEQYQKMGMYEYMME